MCSGGSLVSGKRFRRRAGARVANARPALAVQGRNVEAGDVLERALSHFEGNDERAEAVRTQWELAKSLRGQGQSPLLLAAAYHAALDLAERSRRDQLVAAIETELREIAELELCAGTCAAPGVPGQTRPIPYWPAGRKLPVSCAVSCA